MKTPNIIQFRSQSNRLQGYDYSQNGAYFVTICTKNRECILGEIENQEMMLNDYGNIVKNAVEELSSDSDGIEIDTYIVMPNHIHLLVIICRDAINRISTSEGGGFAKEKSPMVSSSLGTIIRRLKGKSTFEIRKKLSSFSWQSNYYEHIIRNEQEFKKIQVYIFHNSSNWKNDENFLE